MAGRYEMRYLMTSVDRAMANNDYRFSRLQQEHANVNALSQVGIHKSSLEAVNNNAVVTPEVMDEGNLPVFDGSAANLTKGSFRDKLVAGAKFEYEQWNKGKIKENDARMHDRMFRYWSTVTGAKSAEQRTLDLQKKEDSHHWSAAFISTMVKEAGGKDFKFHGMHSYFLTQAADNRKNNAGNYKGYKPAEVKIEVGDLVAYSDKEGVTYDSRGGYSAHSDIVVAVHDNYIETIGGNVSDAVNKTIVKLDKQGKIANSKYHMVVKFNY